MNQYIVDAFTNKPFSGNLAAVCVMDKWPSEESMMKLAMKNNLSETAFIVKGKNRYHLRWFTPGTEVELCGHATLASSYVIVTCSRHLNLTDFEVGASCSMALLSQVSTSYPRVPRDFFARTRAYFLLIVLSGYGQFMLPASFLPLHGC